MMNADATNEIAKTVIGQMGSQIDLMVTLATAVFGGLIALFVQILIHNSDRDKKQIIFAPRSIRLVIGSLMLEGLSVGSGYCARATVTALTPAIFHVETKELESWSDAPLRGRFALTLWASAQFLFFLSGILVLVVFMLRNRQLIGGKKS